MSYVIDASVAAKWYFREHLHEESLLLLNIFEQISAPDCIFYELCNVVKKKISIGQAAPEQAKPIINHLLGVFKRTTASASLMKAAFDISIRFSHSPYDCFYLADAIHKNSKLVTADMEFFDKLRNSPWSASIMSLAHLPYEHNKHMLHTSSIGRSKLDNILTLSKKLACAQKELYKPDEVQIIKRLKKIHKTPDYRSLSSCIGELNLEEKSALLYIIYLGRFTYLNMSKYDILYYLFWSREVTPHTDLNYICANATSENIEYGCAVYEQYAKEILGAQKIISDSTE